MWPWKKKRPQVTTSSLLQDIESDLYDDANSDEGIVISSTNRVYFTVDTRYGPLISCVRGDAVGPLAPLPGDMRQISDDHALILCGLVCYERVRQKMPLPLL